MYKINEITGNLVLVAPIKQAPRMHHGIIMPDTKGKHAVCIVVKVGLDVTNDRIVEKALVAVPFELVNSTFNSPFDLPFEGKEDKQEYFLLQQFGIDMIIEAVPQDTVELEKGDVIYNDSDIPDRI